jgi:hypothetical protein
LFDLYWALTLANPPIDPTAIIESFQHYLRKEGNAAGRAEFIGILEAHRGDRGFCSDMDNCSAQAPITTRKRLENMRKQNC